MNGGRFHASRILECFSFVRGVLEDLFRRKQLAIVDPTEFSRGWPPGGAHGFKHDLVERI